MFRLHSIQTLVWIVVRYDDIDIDIDNDNEYKVLGAVFASNTSG